MVMKNSLKEAPFDSRGDLLHYSDHRWAGGAEWRPNEPMELQLAIDEVRSGRSAKYLMWTDADGRAYPMFVSDLIDLMREADIVHGTVHALFQVRKRGQNFGLCWAGPVPAAS